MNGDGGDAEPRPVVAPEETFPSSTESTPRPPGVPEEVSAAPESEKREGAAVAIAPAKTTTGGAATAAEDDYAWWAKALIALTVIGAFLGLAMAHRQYSKHVIASRWNTRARSSPPPKPLRHTTLWVSLFLRGLILCGLVLVGVWTFSSKRSNARRMWFDRLVIAFPAFMGVSLVHCVVLDVHEGLAAEALQNATNSASFGAYSLYHVVITLVLGGALKLLWGMGRGSVKVGDCEAVVTMMRT